LCIAYDIFGLYPFLVSDIDPLYTREKSGKEVERESESIK
jgi:hypothetical protein